MSVFFIETLEPGVPRGNRRLQEPDKDPPLNSGIKGHFLQGENFGCFLSFFSFSLSTKSSKSCSKHHAAERKDLEFGSNTTDKKFSVVFESQIPNPTSLQRDLCCSHHDASRFQNPTFHGCLLLP